MPLPPPNPSSPRISEAARTKITDKINRLLDSGINEYQGPPPIYDPLAAKGTKEKPFLYALFPGHAKGIRAGELERSINTKLGDAVRDIAEVHHCGSWPHY